MRATVSQTVDKRVLDDVVRLAWPAMLQGLVATVVFFTDRLLLGRYATEAIGSLGVSGALLWSVFSVFGAYAAGIVAVLGRSIGARDYARARATLRAVLVFAGVVGAVVGVLGWLFHVPIAYALTGGEHVSTTMQNMAAEYMGIVFVVAPVQFVAAAGSTALQASGDTRTPMFIGAATGVINLLVSWLLIYGHAGLPEMGVRGAAFGTAAAFTTQFVLVFWWLRRRDSGLTLRRLPDDMSVSWREAVAPVVRVSARSFGERLLFHSAYVTFNALIGHLGDVPLAAHQTLLAIESISFIAADGLSIASGTVVAQKLGSNRPEEARLAGHAAARLGAVLLGVVGLSFLLFPELLIRIFTDDPEVIELGANCFRIAAIAQPFMAISDAFAGALRGAGDTASPMWAALLGPVIVRLTTCYLLAYPAGLGLLGIWIGSTLDWLVRATWMIWRFRSGHWQNIRVL